MKLHLYCLMALLALPSLHAQLEIAFNYDMIEGIHSIQKEDSVTDAAFKQLMSAQGTAGFLQKMRSYRPEVDEISFRESLTHLFAESNVPDLFFYKRVKHKFQTGTEFVANVKKKESQIIKDLVKRIDGFLPANETRKVTVYFVFGAIGGGWTMDHEPNAFYVDTSSFEEDDVIGLQYLCTHEILHLIQDQTRPKPIKNAPTAYFLEQAFREGMATYIADFSTIENASGYALFNQKIYRKNQRRAETNYKLFEVLVIDLFEGRCDYDFVDHLMLSGMYDSPAYFVFYDMIRAMEASWEKTEVLTQFQGSAIAFMRSYQRLNETDYRFSTKLEEVLQQLE